MIIRYLAGVFIVALLHLGVGSLFYLGRIKGISQLFDSDIFVFALPLIAAFTGYCLVTWSSGVLATKTGMRITMAAITAVIASAISTYGMLLFILNKFGS